MDERTDYGGSQQPGGAQTPPTPPKKWNSTPVLIGVAVILLLLACLFGWYYSRQQAVMEPASSQEASSQPYEPGGEPSEEAWWGLYVDDFNLPLDGTVQISSDISDTNGGFSVEYLEQVVTLDPEVPFTVEQVDARTFLLRIEGGQTLPITRLNIQSPIFSDRGYEWNIQARFNCRLEEQVELDGQPIDQPIRVEFSDQLPDPLPQGAVELYLDDGETLIPCAAAVEGNWLALTPEGMLDYATEYRVWVHPVFTTQNGFAPEEDQVLYLRTENRDFTLTMTNQQVHTLRPGEPIQLDYQLETTAGNGREVKVELFSLPGFTDYYALLQNYDHPDISGLERIGEPVVRQMAEGANELDLPAPDSGYALVRTSVVDTKTGEEVASYKPLQVATQSVYLQAVKGQLLLWLNDSATGGPLAGYTVEFTKESAQLAQAVTDSEGVAVVNYQVPDYVVQVGGKGMPEMEGETFVVRDPAGNPVYADTTVSLQPVEDYDRPQERYYSFFYIDRALYRPTDTISFWGYVQAYRNNREPMPSNILVTLDPGGLNQQVQVPLRQDGTFQGELALDQLVSGGYSVQAEMVVAPYQDPYGDEIQNTRIIQSRWIDVKEFTTPAYTISSSVDQPLYDYGEEVQITITPTFFDGTPLPNYPLELRQFDPYKGTFTETVALTTDASGVARYTLKAGELIQGQEFSWIPKRGYFYVQIAHDGENIVHQGSYNYLPASVLIRPTLEVTSEGKAQLTVQANRLTKENITSEAQVEELVGGYYSYLGTGWEKYEVLCGEPVDMDLSVELQTSYVEPVDESYQSDTAYRTLKISNGKGTLAGITDRLDFLPDFNVNVYARVSYYENNNTILESVSASSGRTESYEAQYQEQMQKGYYFNVYRNGQPDPVQSYESFYARNYLEADVGDSLRFELWRDGEKVTQQGGRMLYTLIQDEIIQRTWAQTGFTLIHQQGYANNVMVVAAYFDGKEVWPVKNCYVRTNQESMELRLKVASDKDSYRPGDQVTLDILVEDPDGNPVSSRLCVSVVDEAIFALQDQFFDVISELYGEMSFSNDYVYKYTTATGDVDPYDPYGDGGKGSGGEMAAYDSFRENFKDTAWFASATSGADGRAQVQFTLPDNITSWRVTTLAVGNNLYGGSSKDHVVTTLPFFVKPVLSAKYIDGDEISMLLQGHGTDVDAGDQISYQVRLQGDGVDQTFEDTGEAYQSVQFSFGQLAEGEYTVTATGTLGAYRDTVQLPLSVVHNNLELMVSRPLDLSQPLDLEAMRYPVTITLFDEQYAPYYQTVNRLLAHYGAGADQALARYTAKQALTQHSDLAELPQHLQTTQETFSQYQTPEGGIGYVEGWGSNLQLTLQMLLAAPDQFNLDRAAGYLNTCYQSPGATPLEQAMAEAGMLAADPTRADHVKALLTAQAPAPTLEESLYYLLGLAAAGDPEAPALYEQVVGPYKEPHQQELSLKYSTAPTQREKEQENRRLTGLAWACASLLDLQEEADAYARYFALESWYGDSLFAAVLYVQRAEKPQSSLPDFRYTPGGQSQTLSLGTAGSRTLVLTRSQMEGLGFYDVPQGVAAIAYYIGEPSEAGLTPSEDLSITKTFTQQDAGRYQVTLDVVLDGEASYGYYSISDWIPSNMRLYSIDETPGLSVLSSQENQNLYFSFDWDSYVPNRFQVTYTLQRTFDTSAVVDSAYLLCARTGENAQTQRTTAS